LISAAMSLRVPLSPRRMNLDWAGPELLRFRVQSRPRPIGSAPWHRDQTYDGRQCEHPERLQRTRERTAQRYAYALNVEKIEARGIAASIRCGRCRPPGFHTRPWSAPRRGACGIIHDGSYSKADRDKVVMLAAYPESGVRVTSSVGAVALALYPRRKGEMRRHQ
jgi:hypothetical protein